jgi:hypothetical protein
MRGRTFRRSRCRCGNVRAWQRATIRRCAVILSVARILPTHIKLSGWMRWRVAAIRLMFLLRRNAKQTTSDGYHGYFMVQKRSPACLQAGQVGAECCFFAANVCSFRHLAYKNAPYISLIQLWCIALTAVQVPALRFFTVFRCENTTKHQNRRLSDLTTSVCLARLWQNGAKLSHCMKTRLLHVMFQPRGTINL